MCTLTFIPKSFGYLIGMNRDERLSREQAVSPQIFSFGKLRAVYPREPGGGTWIGANELGITFALLNQSGLAKMLKLRSRGEIIPTLLGRQDISQVIARMAEVDLYGILPFRLVAFLLATRTVLQWSWDGSTLQGVKLPWRTRHWFSSGVSDLPQKIRGRTCDDAWRQRNSGSIEWLRGLHASHAPVRGSFSVCVHRPDAASVSYTEIDYRPQNLVMRYHASHPCQALGRFDSEITLPPRFRPRMPAQAETF
jgi:hypothetical protein